MAKRITKKEKQQSTEQRRAIAEWVMAGKPKTWDWKGLNIIPELFGEQVSEIDKQNAAAEQKDVSAEVTKLKDEALALWKKDSSNAKKLGELLYGIQKLLPKGHYEKWLEEVEINRNRAYYCIRQFQGKVDSASHKRSRGLKARKMKAMTGTLRRLWDATQARNLTEALVEYEALTKELKAWMEHAQHLPVKVVEHARAAGA